VLVKKEKNWKDDFAGWVTQKFEYIVWRRNVHSGLKGTNQLSLVDLQKRTGPKDVIYILTEKATRIVGLTNDAISVKAKI